MKLKTLLSKARAQLVLNEVTSDLPIKRIKLENLKITQPRTSDEIKKALRDGHIAEMTPHQAGW